MLKPWKCKFSQIIRCLIKPLFKNSTTTIFQGSTPWVTQTLKNVIVSMVPYRDFFDGTLLCTKTFWWKTAQNLLSTFLWVKLVHLLWKAISMLKPWKFKVSQIIRCLIKPFLKNSTTTIFQGGTPWVTQILNNVIVSMVPYCAHKLLGHVFVFGFKRTINWK